MTLFYDMGKTQISTPFITLHISIPQILVPWVRLQAEDLRIVGLAVNPSPDLLLGTCLCTYICIID